MQSLRLPCLTTVTVPEGVNWNAVVNDMMSKGIEIAGGLGPTAGKIWRIGTFGKNSSKEVIKKVVDELKKSIDTAANT